MGRIRAYRKDGTPGPWWLLTDRISGVFRYGYAIPICTAGIVRLGDLAKCESTYDPQTDTYELQAITRIDLDSTD